jgi:tetratricopeptide (TPR) repeat protein
MLGLAGTDPWGYPRDTADRVGLLSLLKHARYADLTRYIESFQADFEQDFHKEFWILDALDAFSTPDVSLEPLLDAWVKESPGSFAPHAARGVYFRAAGMARRGTAWAKDTSQEQLAGMRQFIDRATPELARALELRPRLMAANRQQILTGQLERGKKSLRPFVDAAIAACPACFQIRAVYLFSITPRWGGSHEAMKAFAEEAQPELSKNPRLALLKGYADMDRCEQLHLDKRLDEALGACNEALKAGLDWYFLYDEGRVLAAQEKPAEALAAFNRALEIRPQAVDVLTARARALVALGRMEDAGRDVHLALLLDSANRDVLSEADYVLKKLVYEGHQRYAAGDSAEAIHLFDNALLVHPAYKEAFFWRGLAQVKRGAVDLAQNDFEQAIEADPGYYEAYKELDNLLTPRKDFATLVRYWTRLIGVKPDEARAYLERGGAYQWMGRDDPALADLDKACALNLSKACGVATRFRQRLGR